MVSRRDARTGRGRAGTRGKKPCRRVIARMKILFDHGTPAPLRHQLAGHEISTAYEMGWAKLSNGDLLAAAEKSFDAFITTDQNLRYQQNLAGRRLGILVLPTTSWPETP